MRIPPIVTIGPNTYEVRMETRPEMDGDRVDGFIEYDKCVIHLDDTLPRQRRERAFWHEVFHAVAEDRRVRLDETQVHLLADGLLAFLRRHDLLKRDAE